MDNTRATSRTQRDFSPCSAQDNGTLLAAAGTAGHCHTKAKREATVQTQAAAPVLSLRSQFSPQKRDFQFLLSVKSNW